METIIETLQALAEISWLSFLSEFTGKFLLGIFVYAFISIFILSSYKIYQLFNLSNKKPFREWIGIWGISLTIFSGAFIHQLGVSLNVELLENIAIEVMGAGILVQILHITQMASPLNDNKRLIIIQKRRIQSIKHKPNIKLNRYRKYKLNRKK